MLDTYVIAKNFAGSIFNKDVSAMLKLASPLSSAMDELIRAEHRRFADMPKLSVLDTFPKDLYPSIAPIPPLAYDRFLGNPEFRALIFSATRGISPLSRSEAERRRAAFDVIDGGLMETGSLGQVGQGYVVRKFTVIEGGKD